jgi:hypothetical protein
VKEEEIERVGGLQILLNMLIEGLIVNEQVSVPAERRQANAKADTVSARLESQVDTLEITQGGGKRYQNHAEKCSVSETAFEVMVVNGMGMRGMKGRVNSKEGGATDEETSSLSKCLSSTNARLGLLKYQLNGNANERRDDSHTKTKMRIYSLQKAAQQV